MINTTSPLCCTAIIVLTFCSNCNYSDLCEPAMFIIIGVYVMVVKVTGMNAECDQSGACENQFVNSSGLKKNQPPHRTLAQMRRLLPRTVFPVVPDLSPATGAIILSDMFIVTSRGACAIVNFSPSLSFTREQWETLTCSIWTQLCVQLFLFLHVSLTYRVSCHLILPTFN